MRTAGGQILSEMPEGAERRLVLRLLAYWRDLLSDEQDNRLFPSFADIDPTAIHDIWRHCFALDLFGHESGPVFRAVGIEFRGFSEAGLTNLPVSELALDSLAALSSYYFDEVLEKKAPVSRGGRIEGPDGAQILYRSILLPMSDDGETISGFLGAANCREETIAADPEVKPGKNDSTGASDSTDASKEYEYEII